MTNQKLSRIWITLLVLNTIYWLWFWGYFFLHSTAAPQVLMWEHPSPFYEVAGRAFGYEVPGLFHTLPIQSALWLNLPCWLITWPLGQVMSTAEVAGTNAAGLRLVLVTLLSYAQWYLVAKLVQRIRRRSTNNPAPSPVRA